MALEQSRKKIDQIDAKIIQLLEQRFAAVMRIGEYKRYHDLPVRDDARRKTVLRSVIAMGKERWLSESFITELRERIHKETLRLQNIKKPA